MHNLVCPTAQVMKTGSWVRWLGAEVTAVETAVAAVEVVQAVVVGVVDGAAQAVGVSYLFNHFGETS